MDDELVVVGPREKSAALVRKCYHGTVWRWNPGIWFISSGGLGHRGDLDTERVKGCRCAKPDRPLDAPVNFRDEVRDTRRKRR